jgi:hypothetical protein
VEGLALASSPIEGMVAHVELMEWEKFHLKNGTHDELFGNIGRSYWQNFSTK